MIIRIPLPSDFWLIWYYHVFGIIILRDFLHGNDSNINRWRNKSDKVRKRSVKVVRVHSCHRPEYTKCVSRCISKNVVDILYMTFRGRSLLCSQWSSSWCFFILHWKNGNKKIDRSSILFLSNEREIPFEKISESSSLVCIIFCITLPTLLHEEDHTNKNCAVQ